MRDALCKIWSPWKKQRRIVRGFSNKWGKARLTLSRSPYANLLRETLHTFLAYCTTGTNLSNDQQTGLLRRALSWSWTKLCLFGEKSVVSVGQTASSWFRFRVDLTGVIGQPGWTEASSNAQAGISTAEIIFWTKTKWHDPSYLHNPQIA